MRADNFFKWWSERGMPFNPDSEVVVLTDFITPANAADQGFTIQWAHNSEDDAEDPG